MFKIYWTDANGESNGAEFQHLTTALKFSEETRKAGHRFVTMVSENPDHVGKAGVATVSDGKTPDGVDYTWSKQDRAGKSRKSDTVITSNDH